MGVSVIKSGKVYGTANYLLGVAFCSKQIRVGIIFIHIVFIFD